MKFNTLILWIITTIVFSSCQEKDDNRAEKLKIFCEDLFVKNIDSRIIFEKFAKTEDNKINTNDSVIKIFDNHLVYLKTEKKHLLNTFQSFEVKAYNEYLDKDDLLSFDVRAKDNIYIVLVNSKIEFYVLFDNTKIAALNHVQKGKEGPAYFIPF